MKGPEEFFEVFRTASRKPAARPETGGASATLPPEPVQAESEAESAIEPPQMAEEQVRPATEQPVQARQASRGKLPFSIFAEDEPTITIRRSTLVFAVFAVAVLLFIFYALGKRAGRPSAPQADSPTMRRDGLIERGRPAIPDNLRNKWAACVQVLDHTREANMANARAYCVFFNTAPETRFLRDAGKQAFIVSQQQKLHVYIGPFDLPDGPDADSLLPKLQQLAHQGVKKFTGASLEYLGNHRYAKLIY